MAVRLRSLRACGEFVAVMLGLAGAAASLAMSAPEPVDAPPVVAQSFEVELVDLRAGPPVTCTRGYSTVHSAVEVFDTPRDLFPAAPEAAFVSLETAVCFAEEHYLGEGEARLVHFEMDDRLGRPMWVIMGSDGEVVTVAARR